MNWANVTLSKQRRKRLEAGHPWIYVGEIEAVNGEPEAGALLAVIDEKGRRVATGSYHPSSQIRVRIVAEGPKAPEGLSPGVTGLSAGWLAAKFRDALDYRRRWVTDLKACRVLFGEADFVPGLVVDRFNDVLVVQFLTVAVDVAREAVVTALVDVFAPLGIRGIYERSDVPVRLLEGLEQRTGVLWGACPETVDIIENGIQLTIDIVHGQKTGYFFDQQLNRRLLAPLMTGWGYRSGITVQEELAMEPGGETRRIVRNLNGKEVTFPYWDGATVLDAFSHTGGFSMHACQYGAKQVTCLDISETAIAQARENVERNGFAERVEFVCADAFAFLREQVQAWDLRKQRAQDGVDGGATGSGKTTKVDTSVPLPRARQWDVIILDPPAFAKSKSAVEAALRGYKEINLQAIKLLPPGGYLVTASCSYHVRPEMFMEAIESAARDAGKTLRLIEYRGAGPDHPQRIGVDEGNYLNFAIFEVRPRR